MDYTIAIVTYRRQAGLERLLRALSRCRLPSPHCMILVVDNDAEGSAEPVVVALAREHPLPLVYVNEPRPGVVFVRNAALSLARSPRLAFIDDDEEPTADWLVALATTMDAIGAVAVSGPVRPVFARPVPDWFAEVFALCYVRPQPDGSLPELMSGNLLLDMDFLKRHGIQFPTALSTHGAEDTALSGLLRRAGGRLAWAADALVEEYIPEDRLGLAWLLARWYRYGMSDVRIHLLERPTVATRLGALWRGVIRIGGGGLFLVPALSLLLVARPAPALRRCYTILRGAGMASAALGLSSEAYAGRPDRG